MPPFIYPKLSKLKSTMIIYLKKKNHEWLERPKKESEESEIVSSRKSSFKGHWAFRIHSEWSFSQSEQALLCWQDNNKFRKSVKTVHIG